MERYQEGKVYAIICRKTGRRYVGSTCEPTLAKRLAKHVGQFKSWLKTGKNYLWSYEIIRDCDYYIVLLELYPCNSKDELHMCEQKHIDSCECVNKNKAIQTIEERLEYEKQYREQNRDKHREYDKQNYEQNRDNFIAKQKKRYEEKRDEINAKARERVCCPNCEKEMSKGSLSAHKKICPQLKKEIVIDLI
jgi:hypothetical protein